MNWFIAWCVVPSLPLLVLNVFCKRLGLSQDGAPEMSIIIIITIITIQVVRSARRQRSGQPQDSQRSMWKEAFSLE